jgi:membrane peptidoglycan carboxypeptidase
MKLYSSRNVNKGNFKKQKSKSVFPNKTKGKKGKKFLYIFLGVVFFIVCAVLIVAGVYLKNLQNSLPSPDALVDRSSDQSTKIYDRNGVLLYTVYGKQNREFVSIDKVPEYTKWAVLAAEDIEFYQHKGLDYAGIAKAFIQNAQSGGVVRGASTITQQLVKNTLLYDILGDQAYEQRYSRKIKEILITMQIEQTFTKDEILQMYMNEIPLGGVNYGFQAAAKAYFGKDVKDLTLAESALIAGLIQSPGIYSPLFGSKPELAKVRQTYVLDQMLKHKNLTGVTEEEINQAKSEELAYTTKKIDIKAPHFVFYVKGLLEEEFGVERVERGGLKVTTTLDYSIQEIAEDEVVKGITKNGLPRRVNNGAAVVINPNTGEVLAMVGSVDYWNTTNPKVDGNVNIATSNRQVGSSAKPYVYLAAFGKGFTPGTLAPDIPMSFGKYTPKNWDGQFEGLGTARRNLGRSRNLAAVYMLQMTGTDAFLQLTEKLGVTTLKNKADYGLALALGAGEMKMLEHTAAFGVFANEGVKNDTTVILKVEDPKGKILKETKLGEGTRVVDEKEMYLLNYILCDLGGHGDRLGISYSRVKGTNVCFKTGTTDGPKDLTTMMYHKNLVVGVWAGNNDNTTLALSASGSTVPLPIAYGITNRLADIYKPELYTRPAGIVSGTVCRDTGGTPVEGVDCEKEATVYISGRAPQSDSRKIITVCTVNGLIPSNLALAQQYGLVEQKTVLTFKLENKFQQDTYEKYLAEHNGYLFVDPETGECPLPLGPDNAPVVEIITPIEGAVFKTTDTINISGNTRQLETITEFTITIDGTNVPNVTWSGPSFSASKSLSSVLAGTHIITVTAKDNYGKIGTKSVTVVVEKPEVIPPVIPPAE